jgi:AcrR family transcriptional regulator
MVVKPRKVKTGRPPKVAGEKGTKEKIFDAAVELFAERGYDRVSVRDIARAVGVTEAAVYKHYASKDSILDAIFAYVETRLYTPPAPESLDALLADLPFEEILESMPRFMLADPYMPKIMRIMFGEMNHNEKIRGYIRGEIFERPVAEMEILFRKLAEKGKIKPCDPGAMSTLFISLLVYWYFETFLLDDIAGASDRGDRTPPAQIRFFVDLLKPEGDRIEETDDRRMAR